MSKNNKFRHLLGWGLLLAVLFLSVYIIVKQRHAGPVNDATQQAPRAEVTVKGVRFTEEKGGRTVVDLVAATGDFDRTRNVTRLTKVRLVFSDERPRDAMTVTADDAEYDNATRDVRLRGSVLAKGANGAEFRTEQLEYLAAKGVVRSAGRVSLADGNLHLDGVGLEGTVPGRSFRIMREVTAQIGPEGKR